MKFDKNGGKILTDENRIQDGFQNDNGQSSVQNRSLEHVKEHKDSGSGGLGADDALEVVRQAVEEGHFCRDPGPHLGALVPNRPGLGGKSVRPHGFFEGSQIGGQS